MAVSLVGTGTFITGTTNGTSLTLTISTGAATTGDIVVAYWVHTRGSLTSNLVSSAGTSYTELVSLNNGNLGIEAGYRVLTSAETTVASCNTGSAQDSVVLAAAVIRSISSQPLQIVSNSTTGTSSNPNSPAAFVPWANSAVLSICGILANTTLAAPTGFGSTVSNGQTDTRSAAGALAYKSTNSGTTDPSSWTGGASAAWIATTVTIGSTESPSLPMMRTSYLDMVPTSNVPLIGY